MYREPITSTTLPLDQQIIQLSQLTNHIRKALRSGNISLPPGTLNSLSRLEDSLTRLSRRVAQQEVERSNLLALADIGQVVNSSLELNEVLRIVMDTIVRLTGAERGFLMLRDENGELTIRIARNWEQESVNPSEYAISRTIVNRVATQGKPVLTTNAQEDPRFGSQESIVAYNLRSILCVPLKVKDELTGVIYADNRMRTGTFTDAERDLLSAFANQAAVAIENARLYEEAQRRAEQMAALRQMNIALTSTLERDQILEMVLDQLKTILDYDSATIQTLVGPHIVRVVAARPPSHDEELRKGFDASQNPLFYEMRDEKKAVVIDDVHLDDRWVKIGDWEHVRSWVGVPLFARDNFLGFLNVEKGIPGFYKETEVQLLRDFAQGAALAIENARLFEETQRRAVQLETAAEVSRAATSILDTGQLLT